MKRIIVFILIILSISSYSQKENKFISKAKKDLAKKDYQSAIDNLDKALKIKPKSIAAWHNKGNVYNMQKKYLKAIEAYSKAIEFGINTESTYFGRAKAYNKTKQFDKALIDYKYIIKNNPKSTNAFLNCANIYRKQDNNKEALVYFKKVLELEPNNQFSLSIIPQIKNNLKDYEGAIEASDIYTNKFKTYDIGARVSKGIALKRLERYSESMNVFNQLLIEYPNDARLYNQRADLKLVSGNFEKALIDINKAIELDSDYSMAFMTKAEILFKMNTFDKMCESYNKAIELGLDISKEISIDEIIEKCDNK